MAITVSNVGANDDWQSFLGQALGMYLGNRLNTIQTNRAQKMFDTLGQTQQAVTDEDVNKRVQDELAQNDMNMVGMDARAALASRKQKWADLGAQIAQSQQQLAALSGRNDPQAQNLINQLSQQIKQGQERQAMYHDQAEKIRKLGEQRGWNLAGYGANDAYQAADNANDPQYALTYADLGIDEKALQEQAKQSLENEREAQYLLNYNKGAYLAAGKKASQKILTPYAREQFLADIREQADQLEAQAQRYKDARAWQQVSPYLAAKNPGMAAAANAGLLSRDDAYNAVTFQPKGTVIDNGNTNVITYGNMIPDRVYGKGANPDKVIDNQTRLAITDKNNQARLAITDKNNRTSMRNVDAQQKGAMDRTRMGIDYQTQNKVVDRYDAMDPEARTEQDRAQFEGAMKMRDNSVLAGELTDEQIQQREATKQNMANVMYEMKQQGKSNEEILGKVNEWSGGDPEMNAFAYNWLSTY